MLVDSHCHLDRVDLTQFNGQLTAALDYAESCGVTRFLCIATDRDNTAAVRKIARDDPRVYCSVGVHPLSDQLATDGLYDFLINQSAADEVVAIGETGLDGFYAKDTIAAQQASFEQHFAAAHDCQLPLIIHTREARAETLQLLLSKPRENAGVLHCFTEDWPMAKAAIDAGYYVSISGIVTFRQADNVREMAKKIPLDRLLVETDAPYLAPVPHRGKPCLPSHTRTTAEFLAELRNESIEQLAAQTTANFYSLFSKASRHEATGNTM
ncbi:MAG: TatD family hydrolase [Gammaproteobacteria bacterium]|nr:TatD family hydrolase [Gammaproteobacteria bacterium]NVK87762.1 TatD family hydrolase [Gammaproteobacteria bacterium]